MAENTLEQNLLDETNEETGIGSQATYQNRAHDETQRPQENRLTRCYNTFSGLARSQSKNGIKPICVFAMLNTIYNTWKFATEQQALAPILAPGLWSLALLPKVASLYQHNQNISPEIEKVTSVLAAFAVAAMFFYGKNPDRIAAGLFLPHVFTPEHIHLKPIQLFEGATLIGAGKSMMSGAPELSFTHMSIDAVLLNGLSGSILGFGVFKTAATLCDSYDDYAKINQNREHGEHGEQIQAV